MDLFRVQKVYFLICTILLSLVSPLLLAPTPAKAIVCPTIPPTPIINPIAVPVNDTGVLTSTLKIEYYQSSIYSKECLADGLFKMVMKALVHAVTSSIIDWINNGFEGGPSFVTDPAQFFADIADEEIGRFIDGSALGFVCDPFQLQIRFAFLNQRARYKNPSKCTITGIVKNVKGFVGGDFLQGGWEGWRQMSASENNPYGSLLTAEDDLTIRISARQNTAKLGLDWGRGFRSALTKDGKIRTPGALVQDSLSQATGNDLSYLNLSREFDDILIALASLGIKQFMGK